MPAPPLAKMGRSQQPIDQRLVSFRPLIAGKFVDFLLSAASEERLANTGSRQAPVHQDVDPRRLPPDVAAMQPWAQDAAPLRELRTARDACLEWLQSEFAP